MVAGWYDVIRKISLVKYGNCVLYIDTVCVCLSLLPIPLIPSLGKIDWVILLFLSPMMPFAGWPCGQNDDTQE